MNIYYINSMSTLKGPFSIISASSSPILRIGDICILEKDQCLLAMLVVCNDNTWKACKVVGKSKRLLHLKSNKLIFSFDGTKQRLGNIALIEDLYLAFQQDPLNAFFLNALNILTYQCDFWNISLFNEMLSTAFDTSSTKTLLTKKDNKETQNANITIFERYLDDISKSLFNELYQKGISLKEIYQTIRKSYPKEFRTALKSFLNENTQASIYDKEINHS